MGCGSDSGSATTLSKDGWKVAILRAEVEDLRSNWFIHNKREKIQGRDTSTLPLLLHAPNIPFPFHFFNA